MTRLGGSDQDEVKLLVVFDIQAHSETDVHRDALGAVRRLMQLQRSAAYITQSHGGERSSPIDGSH